MIRVYVAGAYRADSVFGVFDNIRKGIKWGIKLFVAGFAPFVPWFDCLFLLVHEERVELPETGKWLEAGKAWVRASDALFVTPGWENSSGTKDEIAEAEKYGIPVFYDYDELYEWKEMIEDAQGTDPE